MIRNSIAKYIGYPLQDLIKKTNILNTLALLRKSQYWSEDRINEYQLKKLKKIINYAKHNVPYYENLFKKNKLDSSDIKSLDDIDKVPILTKEIVRKENHNLVARNFNMKYVSIGKTGGTTGAPIFVYKDIQDRSFTWASYYRWVEWMGINYYDKFTTLWGSDVVLSDSLLKRFKFQFVHYIQNDIYFNSFKLNQSLYPNIYKKIVKYNPYLLKGYVSALIDFAKFLEKNNLEGIRPKVISTTSESLDLNSRKYLKKIFKAPIYDQYGSGEISGISYECSQHNGTHINLEHVIIEILDNDNISILNKRGRIIGTNLDNYIMPFIRYEIGDLSSIDYTNCKCGVKQPRLVSIDGRLTDTIILKTGAKVHGIFFTKIMYEKNILADQIQRTQVYQEIPGEIEFRIETNTKIDKEIHSRLYQSLILFFNKVKIIEKSKLSNEKNGKFKFIINNINK